MTKLQLEEYVIRTSEADVAATKAYLEYAAAGVGDINATKAAAEEAEEKASMAYRTYINHIDSALD